MRAVGLFTHGGPEVLQVVELPEVHAAGSTSGTTVLKWRTFPGFLQAMRIELNYQANYLDDAICQALVAYLGKGMPPREIIDQLIARGFVRDPGNNALEGMVKDSPTSPSRCAAIARR